MLPWNVLKIKHEIIKIKYLIINVQRDDAKDLEEADEDNSNSNK
jgi:hypothetical protein